MGADIKSLIAELRSICNDLRPPVLSRLGLRRAIEENIEGQRAKFPQTKINLELSDDPTPLPDPIAIAFYRIYQQALTNIYRHAKASEVWVRLKLDDEQVFFEIQDNGQGMPKLDNWEDYARQGHLGMIGMNERAVAVNGRMELITGPGEGTLVRVTVPWSRKKRGS
jgi:signal transduction histidine kinase